MERLDNSEPDTLIINPISVSPIFLCEMRDLDYVTPRCPLENRSAIKVKKNLKSAQGLG